MGPEDPRWQLVRILEAHDCADDMEAADTAATLAFVRANADCFGRSNPAGHITASAIVTDPDGRVLMTHHAKLNRWLQVGGHTEPEEYDPLLAALREAREESGLDDLEPAAARPIDVDIHRIPARKSEPAHDHLDVRYHLRTRRPEMIEISEESHDLRWCTPQDLADFDLDPALRRALAKVR